MKKKLILLIGLLLLTACDVDYHFSYKKGVFSEKVTFSEEENPAIDNFEKRFGPVDGDSFKHGTERYKARYRNEGNMNYLDLSFTYDNMSFKESKIFKCFDYSTFEDEKDYYSIRLSGNTAMCPYMNKVSVTFETDREVLRTNATKQDTKNGIYKWDTLDKGIELQISKIFTLNHKASSTMPIRFIAIAVTVLLGAAFVFLRKRQQND